MTLAIVIAMAGCESEAEQESSADVVKPSTEFRSFMNVAPDLLGDDADIKNRYPGVAIFDFDRDGDLDFT